MRELNLIESERLIQKYNIKFADSILVKTPDEAVKAAKKLGYPLVLKAISNDILHKTDVGAVQKGLYSDAHITAAFNKIRDNVRKHNPKAKIKGFIVQKMITSGHEIIIGGKRDPQFGPIVIFGLGGIFVEILNDFSLRICPVSRQDAREMVSEIDAYRVLLGARGGEKANLQAIYKTILSVSDLMIKEKNILELDLNPLFVSSNEIMAVDARVVKNG